MSSVQHAQYFRILLFLLLFVGVYTNNNNVLLTWNGAR